MSITEWLLSPECRRLSFEHLVETLAQKLLSEHIPLWRISTSLRTSHPEVFVKNMVWKRGESVEVFLRLRELVTSPDYTQSPVPVLYNHEASEIALDLRHTENQPYQTCIDLAAEGGTGYCILALDYSTGERAFISFATDHVEGFTPAHLQQLRALVPVLSLLNELAARRFATECLLDVYLGPQAARKVLAGNFMRGQSETLRAAIWFSDMRGFTALSGQVSPERLVEILDLYFDTLVQPIYAHGGEVLKFIGDAVLAIFPVEDTARQSCLNALLAAQDALQAVTKTELPETCLEVGIGLHIGEITFGNVGAAQRLDFTTIGAKVNEASRIEGLCKTLNTPLLMSKDFMDSCNVEGVSLGSHPLKGVTDPMEVFTIHLSHAV